MAVIPAGMVGLGPDGFGNDRGWAAPEAAASIWRMDAQNGSPVQITEAGRSPEDADANYAKYLAYLDGGPWAPLALPASKSVHCKGYAADTNAYMNSRLDVMWTKNGWIQTARYNDDRDEPWHREYFKDKDEHINDVVAPETVKDDGMKLIYLLDDGNGKPVWVLVNTSTGRYVTTKDQNNANSWAEVWGNAKTVGRQTFLNMLDAITKTK